MIKKLSLLLNEEANYWWKAKKVLEESSVISCTRFTKLFLEKYVLKHLENHIELKFLEPKQESILVAEDEAKFIELSKFIPHRVNTDEKKAKRLQPGLKPCIQSKVTVLEIASCAT